MLVTSEYYLKIRDDKKIFVGDYVLVQTKDGNWLGRITHVTVKGFYIDNGEKVNKHFNFTNVVEVKKVK